MADGEENIITGWIHQTAAERGSRWKRVTSRWKVCFLQHHGQRQHCIALHCVGYFMFTVASPWKWARTINTYQPHREREILFVWTVSISAASQCNVFPPDAFAGSDKLETPSCPQQQCRPGESQCCPPLSLPWGMEKCFPSWWVTTHPFGKLWCSLLRWSCKRNECIPWTSNRISDLAETTCVLL